MVFPSVCLNERYLGLLTEWKVCILLWCLCWCETFPRSCQDTGAVASFSPEGMVGLSGDGRAFGKEVPHVSVDDS